MDCFITGTDTGAGKTLVTCGLLVALAELGVAAAAMKPLAAGLETRDGESINEDVALLSDHAGVKLPREVMNPYAFAAPTAPLIAARLEGIQIDPGRISAALHEARRQTEVLLVEGVGGWAMPIGEHAMLADIVRAARLPVVMVAGIRLGALNHSLLTARAIIEDGCQLIGWVANIVDPQYSYAGQTIEALRERIQAPCLATVAWQADQNPSGLKACLTAATALLATPRGANPET